MPKTKITKSRGATITSTAYGEVIFTPSGPMGRFMKKFEEKAVAFTVAAAPANKRPRWAHYGKALKESIISDIEYRPGDTSIFVAIGADTPYAAYVDQGTSPFEAKILPPWPGRRLQLYDYREYDPRTGTVRGTKTVSGQEAQEFMDAGIRATFVSLRMSFISAKAIPGITAASSRNPAVTNIQGRFGNTPSDPAFKAQLAVWRKERRKYLRDLRKARLIALGIDPKRARERGLGSVLGLTPEQMRDRIREQSRARSKRYYDANIKSKAVQENEIKAAREADVTKAPKYTGKKDTDRGAKVKSLRDRRADFVEEFITNNPGVQIESAPGGVLVRKDGKRNFFPWSRFGLDK